MPAMFDAQCKCGKRFGWSGTAADRPACPRCGHRPPQEELEAADREMEEFERLLAAQLEAEVCREREACERLQAALADAQARAEAGARFKAFVHAYLDQHGVPHGDPDNEHQREGRRVGARLDLLFRRLNSIGDERDSAKAQRDAEKARADAAVEGWAACREAALAVAGEWREKALLSRQEANRIRATIKDPTDAEERCNVRAEVWMRCCDELQAALARPSPGAGRLRALEEALAFYADPSTWRATTPPPNLPPAYCDEGQKARDALARLDALKEQPHV